VVETQLQVNVADIEKTLDRVITTVLSVSGAQLDLRGSVEFGSNKQLGS